MRQKEKEEDRKRRKIKHILVRIRSKHIKPGNVENQSNNGYKQKEERKTGNKDRKERKIKQILVRSRRSKEKEEFNKSGKNLINTGLRQKKEDENRK